MREMKDSGIEWIGTVPEDWEVSKIDVLYNLRNTKVSDRDYQALSVTKQGILPQLENVAKTNDGDSRKLVMVNDFVINSRSDRRGSCGISVYEGSVSLINTVLMPNEEIKMNNQYYDWLFHTTNFSDEFYKWGHGIVDDLWTTGWQEMRKIVVTYPPLSEQNKIAAFLDKKCGQIDKLSEKLQGEIEKLQEYKKSLISETVTQGLDKNVAMKDSGVDWIGKIPKHWEMHPTYVYFEEHKNINYRGKENNLLSLSYGKIIRKDINTNGGLLPENFNGYNIVEKDNIVFRLTDLQNDKKSLRTGLVTEKGIITSAYITLQKKEDIHVPFYNYLYHSYDVKKVFYNMGGGVRQGLNYAELSKLMLVNPPLAEQQAIAAFLDDKCSQLDAVIAKKQQQVSILADYKKSLIYEYVTGKKEVTADEVH